MIIDVGPRCNTDTAYHGCQLVGHIIAVQIERSNHRIVLRIQQCVLQEGIGNAVFHNQFAFVGSLCQSRLCRLLTQFLLQLLVIIHGKGLFCKLFLCHLISPAFETTFRIFHDIPFMHQSH